MYVKLQYTYVCPAKFKDHTQSMCVMECYHAMLKIGQSWMIWHHTSPYNSTRTQDNSIWVQNNYSIRVVNSSMRVLSNFMRSRNYSVRALSKDHKLLYELYELYGLIPWRCQNFPWGLHEGLELLSKLVGKGTVEVWLGTFNPFFTVLCKSSQHRAKGS